MPYFFPLKFLISYFHAILLYLYAIAKSHHGIMVNLASRVTYNYDYDSII
jgi:hypothetical protein